MQCRRGSCLGTGTAHSQHGSSCGTTRNFDARWLSSLGFFQTACVLAVQTSSQFDSQEADPCTFEEKQRGGEVARHMVRAETWTCEERHRRHDRQSLHKDVARVQGEAGTFNLCTWICHVRCAAVVLCIPTHEEVKGAVRSSSARHSKVCRSERHLATPSGGGFQPLHHDGAQHLTSSTAPSSTDAGTATSLVARYLRQSGGRYACCCPLPTWTLAISSFVTTTVLLRVRPLAVGSFFSGVRGHLCHSSALVTVVQC